MSQTTSKYTVVNTRPVHQSSEFSRKLRGLDITPIEFPTIEIREPENWGPVDDAISNLQRYDWIVFTSQNGVETFFHRVQSHDIEPSEFINLFTAAIGPATAKCLEQFHITVDVQPDVFCSETLADDLVDSIEENQKVLLPRSNISRPVLVDRLVDNGIDVNEIHPYVITEATGHSTEKIKQMDNNTIDLICFTSSMTVEFFDDLIDRYDLEQLRTHPAACIGPITAETAREKGFQTPIIAERYTIDGLTDDIQRYGLDVS